MPTKGNNRYLIYGALVVVFMLLNLVNFAYSSLTPTIEEINYTTFLDMIAHGEIDEVEIRSTSILITSNHDEEPKTFITGAVPDPDLVERLIAAGVVYSSPVPAQRNLFLEFTLEWIMPLLFILMLGEWMLRSVSRRMGSESALFGRSNAKVYNQEESTVAKTFADVAGQEEGKRSLLEIVDFLHNPARYTAIGANIPKGVLLVGPPGTGKTLLAQATAGEAGVPFFSITGSNFVEMFAGMGAARVRELFKSAQAQAPCIVFIDEIDTIGKRRDVGFPGGNDEREQTLNQLLSEMDGFDGSKGVVLIGATNRPEILDQALLRPGRFDRRVPVELPDFQGRVAILKVHIGKVKTESRIDIDAIARATPGASGADLANIINEAALLAVRNKRVAVSQSDLENAVETVIAGEQRTSALISEKERKIIAVHEMGHALVGALSEHSMPVRKITIVPRTSGALGYTMQVPEDESFLMSKDEALTRIRTLLAGRAAEELIFSRVTSGAANDIEQATRLARAMVTRLGMSDAFDMMHLESGASRYLISDGTPTCAPETAARIDDEILRIIRTCHEEAKDLLRHNKYRLMSIANELLAAETLSGERFQEFLQEYPIGEKAPPEPVLLPEPEYELIDLMPKPDPRLEN